MELSEMSQAFLQIMANMQKLTASDAAQSMATDLHILEQRDRESCATIDRLTEDRYKASKKAKYASDKIQELENKVDCLREEIDQVQKSLAEMDDIADKRGQELKEKSERVMQLEKNIVGLTTDSGDNAGTRWSALWTSVYELAADMFSVDLDAETLEGAVNWDPLTSHQHLRDFPSPPNNTKEAKQMRIVGLCLTIASALTRHIFQPPFGIDPEFDGALSNLARANPDMESFYRSSHLAVIGNLPGYKDSVLNRAVKTAVKEILRSVGQILPTTKSTELRVRLEEVCQQASQDWQAIQRYKERYEVDIDGDQDFYESVPLWQPVDVESRKTNGAKKTLQPSQSSGKLKAERRSLAEGRLKSAVVVATVWPLLRAVGAAGTGRIISGWALFSDQTRQAAEQVSRKNRRANREESRQDEKRVGPRPVSLGAFLPMSPKSA